MRAAPWIALSAAALLGCGAAQASAVRETPVEARSDAPIDVASLEMPPIVRVSDGAPIALGTLAAELASARVIYVGERHDQALDHRVQLEVIRLVMSAGDQPVALGLEMVQRPYQDVLSAYAAGTIDEEALLTGTEWRERWRLDFALYRPLFALARERGSAIVALNAPREWTRAVGRGGLESLDAETRAQLPELDLTSEAHRTMVMGALEGHPGMDAAMLERMYTAQVIWDETMADSVARTLAATTEPTRMVVLAGAMHVQHGLGIPARAARRGAGPHRIVCPITGDELGTDVADYGWIVEDEEP